MHIQFIGSINEVTAAQWNALTGIDYPFLRHELLSALEESGVATLQNGWQPQHLLVLSGTDLIAVCPLYLKYHSQGEFVFDHQWANAYQQQGLKYYPKGLTAIPFTPCLGQRLAFKAGVDKDTIFSLMIDSIKQHFRSLDIGTWHCLFSTIEQTEQLQMLGLLLREGVQFHWFNRGYQDFQDYVEQFNARKRKNTRREREDVRAQGINFLSLTGHEVSDLQWQAFFKFYQMTYLKHGRPEYLNLDFFKLIARTMPEQLLLIFALKDHRYIGAAFSFVGNDTLYGRYWGCFEEYQFLHFEACYYQGLEYCIAKGLKRFDSGAQGEHKIARGFEPITTYSAHWIQDPGFANAVQHFLNREKVLVQQYKTEMATLLPFKRL